MVRVAQGSVGILPAGALGVAYFYHLTDRLQRLDGQVFFLERPGSVSGAELRRTGRMCIQDQMIELGPLWRGDLVAELEAAPLPEVVLVCTQSDQLLAMMKLMARLLEALCAREGLERAVEALPIFVLTSNGIYFQRVRQYFGEVLEEAMMFGRLPDLWEGGQMNRVVGKLLRGVTIQVGLRDGSGPGAVYRPGARGPTRLAGGDPVHRERVAALLGAMGGWFEVAAKASPTRVEFDKALINLCVNLLGQVHAIDEAGRFRKLTVRDILAEEGSAETQELARHVIAVGRAVRAYGEEEDFEGLHRAILDNARQYLEHVPSSLQRLEQQLQKGTLEPRLAPTEQWLLEPLIRYAHGAGLEEAAHYFERLTRLVEHRLALARQAAGR